MKKHLPLFAVLVLAVASVMGQGFGSFSHDQPFFAKDIAGSSDPCTFVPTNIADCFFWVSANVTNSVLSKYGTNAAINESVGQWKDLSGNNYHVSNAIAAANPPDFKTVSGRLAVRFDSPTVYDYLTNTFMPSKTNPLTMFFATGTASFTSARMFFADFNETDFFFQAVNPSYYRFYTPAAISTVPNNFFSVGSWNILSYRANGTNGVVRTNGVVAVTTTSGSISNSIRNGIRLGAPKAPDTFNGYDGYLSEVILYNRALSDTEMRQVEAYMSCLNNIVIY